MNRRVTDPAEFGKVAVLMGGWSAERTISLKTGAAVLEALRRRGVAAEGLDAGADVLTRLLEGGYDRAFIALHGRGGEDGCIQGALGIVGVPYTGSGVVGSAIGMDKLRTKRLWQGAGVPTPAFAAPTAVEELDGIVQALGLPLMVKPANEGSSIGMTKVMTAAELEPAWRAARAYDADVLVERWIGGGEYTAAVLGNDVLPMIRLETPRAFYDYAAKYEADTTRYHCPAGLAAEVETSLAGLARAAFDAIGASGWGRVDFLLDEAGEPWLIEVNTVPGLTDHSLVPMAARAAGIDFDELAWRILETSLAHTPAAATPGARAGGG